MIDKDDWRGLAIEAQEAAAEAASTAREWLECGAVTQACAWQTRAALYARIARYRTELASQ